MKRYISLLIISLLTANCGADYKITVKGVNGMEIGNVASTISQSEKEKKVITLTSRNTTNVSNISIYIEEIEKEKEVDYLGFTIKDRSFTAEKLLKMLESDGLKDSTMYTPYSYSNPLSGRIILCRNDENLDIIHEINFKDSSIQYIGISKADNSQNRCFAYVETANYERNIIFTPEIWKKIKVHYSMNLSDSKKD